MRRKGGRYLYTHKICQHILWVFVLQGISNFLFACHNIEYEPVGIFHAFGADKRKVTYAEVYIIVDNSFYGRYAFSFHCEHGRHKGGRDSAAEFHGTTGFGSVADHSCQVSDHVFDSECNLFVIAAHEQGYSATRTGRGDDTAAQGGEASEALFDVYGGQMAEG